MKILHRYLFLELLKIFIISVLFLTGILFLDKILFLTELIFNRGVTFLETIRMMLYISPAFLTITIPISALVAAVGVFNQLSVDSEIVAMRANGWSFLDLLKPVLIFAVFAYALNNVVVFSALPWGNKSFKKMVFDIVRNRANIDIKPKVFNQDFKHLILFVGHRKTASQLENLFVADTSNPGSSRIILSKTGTIVSDPDSLKIQLQLRNGTIHNTTEEGRNYQILNFDRYDVTLSLPSSDRLEHEILVDNRELALGPLMKRIREKQSAGQPAHRELVELSKKFSIPITCILFALAGAPLGVKSRRSGKSGGFVLCALIVLSYYVGLISMQNLGSVGEINAFFSVWVPNIILLVFGVYLVYKTHRELPFVLLEGLIEWTSLVLDGIRDWAQNKGRKEGRKDQPPPYAFGSQQVPVKKRARQVFPKKTRPTKAG